MVLKTSSVRVYRLQGANGRAIGAISRDRRRETLDVRSARTTSHDQEPSDHVRTSDRSRRARSGIGDRPTTSSTTTRASTTWDGRENHARARGRQKKNRRRARARASRVGVMSRSNTSSENTETTRDVDGFDVVVSADSSRRGRATTTRHTSLTSRLESTRP